MRIKNKIIALMISLIAMPSLLLSAEKQPYFYGGVKLFDYGIENEAYIFVIKVNTKTLLEDRQNQQNLLLDNFMSILNQFNITGGVLNNQAQQPIQ